jgi:HEAT repeat protein
MTFFCPICWKEIKYDDKRCPMCAADITEYEKKSFEEKLINALKHPERETVQRAVWILGRLKSIKAVKPLIILFEQTDNPYLKVEILDSMNILKTPDAIDVIVKALDSVEGIVRRKAKELVERREYISEEK